MAQWRCIKESRLAGETGIVSAFYPPPSRSSPPPPSTRERGRASARFYIVAKKYILEERKIYRGKEREGEKSCRSSIELRKYYEKL